MARPFVARCPRCHGTRLSILKQDGPQADLHAVRCEECEADWLGPSQRVAQEFYHAEERRVSCGECLGWGFRVADGRRVPMTDVDAWNNFSKVAGPPPAPGRHSPREACQRCGGHVP